MFKFAQYFLRNLVKELCKSVCICQSYDEKSSVLFFKAHCVCYLHVCMRVYMYVCVHACMHACMYDDIYSLQKSIVINFFSIVVQLFL